MQLRARKHAALTFVAIAACAQAPSFDEEVFGGTELVIVDASTLDAGIVVLDAGLGGAPGSAAQAPRWLDASGADTIDASRHDASERAPAAADAASAFDAATGVDVPPENDDAPMSTGPMTPGEVGSDGGAGADAAERATDASSAAPARDAAAVSCNPLACRNNCLALPRCCNEDNECACFDLGTRECSLPSL